MSNYLIHLSAALLTSSLKTESYKGRMTTADSPPEYFPPQIHHLVGNDRKMKPLMADGNVHPAFMRILQGGLPAGSGPGRWNITFLGPIYYDMVLQMMLEGGIYRTSSTFVSLLNLHKKMTLWSDPQRFHRWGMSDLSVWIDFKPCLHRQIWQCVMGGEQLERYIQGDPQRDPRELDRAFAAKLDAVLVRNGIEGSDRAVFDWADPREPKRWLEPLPLKQPEDDTNGDGDMPDVDTMYPRLVDGPKPEVWRRPENIDNLEEINYFERSVSGERSM